MTAAATAAPPRHAVNGSAKTKARTGSRAARAADAALARAEKTAPKALTDKIEQIRADIRKLSETDIKRRWELGREIHSVMTDASGRYGDDPAEAVQALLPLSRDSLRPMVVMAERYDEADIDKLINLRHPRTEEGLTWTHVMAISRVRDKDKAMALAREAVASAWSSKDLAREVTAASGGPRSSGGRKSKKHATLTAALTDIRDRSDAWYNAARNAWLAEGGLTELAAADKPSADAIKALEQALAANDRLTAQTAVVGREINLILSTYRGAVGRRKVAV